MGAVLAAAGFEAAAQILFALRPVPQTPEAHPYVIADDPAHPWHRRLRPGFVESYAGASEFAHQTGRVLGERYLAESAGDPAAPYIRINSDGFRGPPLDRSHAARRIVTIGDSCTFGMSEAQSYPRVLERVLREKGKAVEVVNAGVEGYSPRDVLLELDRLKALRPDVATVYLGWNALFDEDQVFGRPRLASWRLVRAVAHRIPTAFSTFFHTQQEIAMAAYSRQKRPDRNARAVAGLDRTAPALLNELRQIVRALAGGGDRVVLFTLPGLYELDRSVTDRMLQIGHLPTFTDNPYVLAKLTAVYNEQLKSLARAEGAGLVDLDAWSRQALEPRERYFADSVHLTDAGQELLGIYLAGVLASDPGLVRSGEP
jgi:lysophospholipase L1-like esterase